MVDGDLQFGGLGALAQKGHFIEGDALVGLAAFIGGHHAQGPDGGEFGGMQALEQIAFGIVIHQEADGAAVHAVDGGSGRNIAVQGLQHVAIAAERHNHIG